MEFAVFWLGITKTKERVRGTTIVQADCPSRARYEVAVKLMAENFVSLAFTKTKRARKSPQTNAVNLALLIS